MTTEARTGLLAAGIVFGGALLLGVVVVGVKAAGGVPVFGGRAERVTAEELGRAYEENPAAGARRWDGVRVEAVGEVESVERKNGVFYLCFKTGCRVKGPAASFTSPPDALARLKPGDRVRVTGRVVVRPAGQVEIADAAIVG